MSKSFGQRLFLFVLLWLAGACLRLTILAVPPLVPLLHADLRLTETGLGWLSSLPPMLFALTAVPSALLIARMGVLPTLLAGLLLTAAGAALRGAVAQAGSLFASTIAMGAGAAVVQTVMPPLVRLWFPRQIGFATSVYANGLLVGEIVPVALTIPFILPLVNDSWRLDFVLWSAPVFATALLIAVSPAWRGTAGSAQTVTGRQWWPDWRDPLIWRLGLILGSVNSTYFVTNAFLPDLVTAAGRPDLLSAALTAINLGQLPASFLMLPLAERLVTRPWAYVITGLLSSASVTGLLMSGGLWIVFWSAVLGFTGAAILILALALPSLLSPSDDVHRTTAGMFTISYSCAMALSVVVGWLWDATRLPIAAFAPIACCGLVIVGLSSTVKYADRRPSPKD